MNLKNWGLELKKERPDIEIAGSPERAISRWALEDTNGDIYVAEFILDVDKKEKIASVVNQVGGSLPVAPYVKSLNGNFVVEEGLRSYLLSQYVEGEELERPGYVQDAWRGRALAEFLLGLEKAKPKSSMQGVSLKDYVKEMVTKLNMQDYREVLEEFFNEDLEQCFCHGDLHPLNVIWGEGKINAVIDWEFCGMNYKGYDAANLLGCLGIEHPDYLFSPFAKEFIQTLKKASFLTESDIEFLPELILATRFGWLAEWLRKKDNEMVKREKDYMKYLKDKLQWLKINLNPEKQSL